MTRYFAVTLLSLTYTSYLSFMCFISITFEFSKIFTFLLSKIGNNESRYFLGWNCAWFENFMPASIEKGRGHSVTYSAFKPSDVTADTSSTILWTLDLSQVYT